MQRSDSLRHEPYVARHPSLPPGFKIIGTIAYLAGDADIASPHLTEALQYR
jgi:predicted ATPase with chaperone activity